ncbi:PRC-barrel domain-containing protein [Sporosarcina limicola]|uniref:Sporulation protein YlmC with PRC-barrel domain n=1 Tax=Sporosarcina limicola TaxID=34101 RepID=A0A927R257_9BACL|nr:PRC-barrel domain-containing protein [Sporosarcina limicola]MBE1553546.1 sporulation protein YlmC with PRC-barrel domain [Sporosarcina limicola]
MKFSEIQKKEVIDVTKGAFLGFVQDATIDIVNGKVESFHVGGGDRNLFFDVKDKEIKRVRLEDVATIGKDIVLVGKKDEKK